MWVSLFIRGDSVTETRCTMYDEYDRTLIYGAHDTQIIIPCKYYLWNRISFLAVKHLFALFIPSYVLKIEK